MRGVTWHIHGGGVLGPAPFLIAGIVNVTPDSFYDGGRYADADSAASRGAELIGEGADILDVGGESTRPFSEPVDARTEKDRVLPVIRSLAAAVRERRCGAVSVDTYKAEVALAALREGAAIVNDVSACRFDPALMDVLASEKPGYVLMHSLGRPSEMQVAPEYDDVVDDILAFFEERLAALTRAGLPEDRVVLDPGIGFGKTLEHNLEIMRGVERFHVLGRPLFIGLSNKSIWEKLLGLEPGERGEATLAATVLMAGRGVAVHRVHEVKAARRALETAASLEIAVPEEESNA
jgi:dihydropteroate synthase